MDSSSSQSSKPSKKPIKSAKKERHITTQKSVDSKPPTTKASTIEKATTKVADNSTVANVGGRGDAVSKNAKKSEENSKSTKADYARSSKPVRMIVEAERRYNKCVNKARKRRKELLKRAVFEATDELRQLRKRMDDAYIDNLERLSIEEKTMAEDIGAETERNLKEMRERFFENRPKALKLLSDAVEDINPRPHRNLTLRQKMEQQFQ